MLEKKVYNKNYVVAVSIAKVVFHLIWTMKKVLYKINEGHFLVLWWAETIE